MAIDVNNLTRFKLNPRDFSTVAKKVLSGENREIEISLAFVTAQEMQKLNKKHRGKNKPTDVLSFEGINEIVICPQIVRERKEDIIEVFIHGVLHLLGYDHEKSQAEERIMFEKQDKYLSQIKAK